MIEEHAIVVGVEQELALLEVVRRTPCGLCGQTRGCGISLWGRLFGHRNNIFRAANQIGAKVGDSVVVGVDEHALLTSSLAAYGAPLLALLAGALLGNGIGSGERADLYAAIGALAGLALGLLWLKMHMAGRGLDARYRPVILRADDMSSGGTCSAVRS
jgi:sigma-E factor negative regulatory protein RseC